MTAAAPAPIRIRVICLCCPSTARIWKTQAWIDGMIAEHHLVSLPFERAYAYVCAKHQQAVSADAPIERVRSTDPERRTHSKRTSGGYHTQAWRTR